LAKKSKDIAVAGISTRVSGVHLLQIGPYTVYTVYSSYTYGQPKPMYGHMDTTGKFQIWCRIYTGLPKYDLGQSYYTAMRC